MRSPLNPFAQAGAASSVFALKDELDRDFVSDSQLDMTPFQRQVFEAEKAREAEAQQEQREQARNPGGGRQMNSMNNQSPPASSGRSQSETVRYINEGDSSESADDDTLSVI